MISQMRQESLLSPCEQIKGHTHYFYFLNNPYFIVPTLWGSLKYVPVKGLHMDHSIPGMVARLTAQPQWGVKTTFHLNISFISLFAFNMPHLLIYRQPQCKCGRGWLKVAHLQNAHNPHAYYAIAYAPTCPAARLWIHSSQEGGGPPAGNPSRWLAPFTVLELW